MAATTTTTMEVEPEDKKQEEEEEDEDAALEDWEGELNLIDHVGGGFFWVDLLRYLSQPDSVTAKRFFKGPGQKGVLRVSLSRLDESDDPHALFSDKVLDGLVEILVSCPYKLRIWFAISTDFDQNCFTDFIRHRMLRRSVHLRCSMAYGFSQFFGSGYTSVILCTDVPVLTDDKHNDIDLLILDDYASMAPSLDWALVRQRVKMVFFYFPRQRIPLCVFSACVASYPRHNTRHTARKHPAITRVARLNKLYEMKIWRLVDEFL
jgi:hypothetical protein